MTVNLSTCQHGTPPWDGPNGIAFLHRSCRCCMHQHRHRHGMGIVSICYCMNPSASKASPPRPLPFLPPETGNLSEEIADSSPKVQMSKHQPPDCILEFPRDCFFSQPSSQQSQGSRHPGLSVDKNSLIHTSPARYGS